MENLNFIVIADDFKYINHAVKTAEWLLKCSSYTAIFNLQEESKLDFNIDLEDAKDKIYIDENKNLTIKYIEDKIYELKKEKDLNLVILDLEDKQLEIDYKQLSQVLNKLAHELDILVYIFPKLKEEINDNDFNLDNIKNKEITEYADEVWFCHVNKKHKSKIYVAKSNLTKTGFIKLKKGKRIITKK